MIRLTRPWIRVLAIAPLALAGCGDTTEPPAPRPAVVAVTPSHAEIPALGQTVQFTAEVRDQDGRVMTGVALTWSTSTAAVASVDASGLVTAASNGAATITAAAGAVSGTAAVTVVQVVADVAVSSARDTVVARDTLRLMATAFDANGHTVERAAFTWSSSDASVATVDASGLVTGARAGEAVVMATSGEVTGKRALVVMAPVPTTVAVSPDSVSLVALADKVRLAADVRDQIGRPLPEARVTWSTSDTAVATVDREGLVTAAGNGAATITAAAGAASGTATVTVAQVVADVAVSSARDTVVARDTLRLMATAFDANGQTVERAAFTWSSSDTAVATVDASGLVTGARAGEAVVMATSGDVTGKRALVVMAPVPTTVAVSPDSVSLVALADTVRLVADVRDQIGRPLFEARVMWSTSDTAVATVDREGLVTAAGNGAATITAAAGAASGTAAVTVAQVAGSVVVTPVAATVVEADTLRLAALAVDANGHEVTGTALAWASADTLVAVVDASGLVTGVGEGAVVVEASTASGLAGQAAIDVVPPVASAVSVTPDSVVLVALGASARLSAEVLDQVGRVMEGAAVAWTSGDTTVAVVDSAGVVTAVSEGTAAVTATAGAASGTAAVTVAQVAGSVVLTPAADTVAPGDTLRLAAEAYDANGHAIADAEFAWSSSDVSVATVDGSTGLVRGAAEGTATITAVAGQASGTSEITVVNPDRAALVALFEATDGSNWRHASRWGTDAPIGQWYGVYVNGAGRVEFLLLRDNGLSGEIPTEIGDLTALRGLELGSGVGDRRLTGFIPPELGNLTALEWLDLGGNYRLVGPIPPELGKLTRLKELDLGFNQLTGSIPPELGKLTRLEELDLGSNRLTGSIPPALGKLKALKKLFLGENHLTGSIPAELGELPALEVLSVRWSGPIPPELANFLALRWLRLSGDFTEIPPELGNLTSLESLVLEGSFAALPPELGKLTALETLSLRPGSTFDGQIPPELGNLTSLKRLELYGITAIPMGLGKLLGLEGLSIVSSQLSGPIPSDLGNLTRLRGLSLREGDLSGPIPPELGDMASLEGLDLSSNRLSGPIPPELGKLTALTRLLLHTNNLTGPIPAELGNLARLSSLVLRGNPLTGPLPVALTNLDQVWLSLPDHMCVPGTEEWQSVRSSSSRCNEEDRRALIALYFANGGTAWNRSDGWGGSGVLSDWEGVTADSVGRVTGLDLAGNNLTGALRWLKLPVLERLDLSDNMLTSITAARLEDLAGLRTLVISENPQMVGRLPLAFSRMPLDTLRFDETGLCSPLELSSWLASVAAVESSRIECEALTDRSILSVFYDATRGPDWLVYRGGHGSHGGRNWLTNAPLRDWEGVNVDEDGRVVSLDLRDHGLRGIIPPELGKLFSLRRLDLGGEDHLSLTGVAVPSNELRGSIPVELGDLAALEFLDLSSNPLTGPIPPELGKLTALRWLNLSGELYASEVFGLKGRIPPELERLTALEHLDLSNNDLTGQIPPELGSLTTLKSLNLSYSGLTGPIPPELGKLTQLQSLNLSGTYTQRPAIARSSDESVGLVGRIPPELGDLAGLRFLDLSSNELTGQIPSQIGNLHALTQLDLSFNSLSGPVPSQLGNLALLRRLSLSGNEGLSGSLPGTLTSLRFLWSLLASDTGLCAPLNGAFSDWLNSVERLRLGRCNDEQVTAYLVQAIQSFEDPVPLVARREALLRVFVPTLEPGIPFPPIRARFYAKGIPTHTAEIPSTGMPLRSEISEGRLDFSANIRIPEAVIVPGLELVVEIDPAGTLDPKLRIPRRLPTAGRMALDVRAMPIMELNAVPFQLNGQPDSELVAIAGDMAEDPEGHSLLSRTRTYLPIADLAVVAHEPVWTSTTDFYTLLSPDECDTGNGGWARLLDGPPPGSRASTGFSAWRRLSWWLGKCFRRGRGNHRPRTRAQHVAVAHGVRRCAESRPGFPLPRRWQLGL